MEAGLRRNPWLVAGGAASLAASVAHLMVIVGGGDWYRFLGAGEAMARAAERGDWRPAALTAGIAATLAVFAYYAFAGAGLLPRPPLIRVGLVVITLIYLARGLILFFPAALRRPDLSAAFLLWSSAIVLAIGILHALGTWRALELGD